MDTLLSLVTSDLLMQALPVLLAGLAAYLARAAKAWLDEHVQGSAMARLVAALERAGQLAAQEFVAGKDAGKMEPAVASMVGYVQSNLPDTVAKLAPTAGTLADMAKAVLLDTLTKRGAIALAGAA